MFSVERISTTPVKGTALHHPGAVEIGRNGVADNRLFHLIDAHGLLVNGKRVGQLVQLYCRYDAATNALSIRSPAGETVAEPVVLTADRVETNFYGRSVPGTVVGGRLADFVRVHVGADLRLVRVDEPGAGVDVHPVTLISAATANYFRERAGGPPHHWRDRFRILLELEGLEPFEEESWEGLIVDLGAATVSVVGPVPRCVVTSQNPRSGAVDFDTLAALRTLRGARARELSTPTEHLPDGGRFLLGVYARVVSPGLVRLGDRVEVNRRTT
jgi:uncharacterized protein YcbX